MIKVFLLLGSNLGNRQDFLTRAIYAVEQHISPVIITSSIYETQSWGKSNQPDYLNQVIVIETERSARNILDQILRIEQQLGRERGEKWGSRTIDIDILFYGDEIIDEPGLTIPHPELHNRAFTLAPLAEIAPQMMHPVFEKSISDLKNLPGDMLIVKKL